MQRISEELKLRENVEHFTVILHVNKIHIATVEAANIDN